MVSNEPLLSWRGAMIMSALVFLPSFKSPVLNMALAFKPWLPNVMIALMGCAVLVTALIARRSARRIPVWLMPLLGTMGFAVPWNLTLEAARIFPKSLSPLNLSWAIIVGLFIYYVLRRHVSRAAWVMLGVYLCVMSACMVSGIDFSALYLFPVALGLLIARQQGVEALLFAVTGIAVAAQWLEPDYQLLAYGDPLIVASYNILWQLLAFAAAPLWMVRARSDRGRLMGATLPILGVLILNLIVGIVYRSITSQLLLWFGVALVQLMLAIGVAYALYRPTRENHSPEAEPTGIETGAERARAPVS